MQMASDGEYADRLARDERCAECGYNLRSQLITGECPECGRPVAASLVEPVGPGWHWSVKFFAVASAVAFAVFVFLAFLNGIDPGPGPVRATRLTMQVLDQSLTEYNFETGGLPADVASLDARSSRAFVSQVQIVTSVATMIDGLGAVAVVDDDDDPRTARIVVDGWGNPIVYRAYSDPRERNADRPFPTRGSSTDPRPFFASAGRDGKWGDLSAPVDSDAYRWTRDNILSFELE